MAPAHYRSGQGLVPDAAFVPPFDEVRGDRAALLAREKALKVPSFSLPSPGASRSPPPAPVAPRAAELSQESSMSRTDNATLEARREALRARLAKGPASPKAIVADVPAYAGFANAPHVIRGDAEAIGAVRQGGRRGLWALPVKPKAAKPAANAVAPAGASHPRSLQDFSTRELLEELLDRDADLRRAIRGR